MTKAVELAVTVVAAKVAAAKVLTAKVAAAKWQVCCGGSKSGIRKSSGKTGNRKADGSGSGGRSSRNMCQI